jgi:hypothetical protein
MRRALVIGSEGNIGAPLVRHLRTKYGELYRL